MLHLQKVNETVILKHELIGILIFKIWNNKIIVHKN